jgi:hypothetical protein
MKIVSQQTKQDRDLEDSYVIHFADEVLCPNTSERVKFKSNIRKSISM